MSNLIAISGKIGSGKDELSKMIQYISIDQKINDKDWRWSNDYFRFTEETSVKHFSSKNKWEVKRFADKIKDTVCLWLGCTREQLEDREFKEKPLGEEWDKWRISWEDTTGIRHEKIFSDFHEAHNFKDSQSIVDPTANAELIKMTPRKLMQLLGTDCGREIIHPDIWVNALFADYKKTPTPRTDYNKTDYFPNWIIPDMRFPNEASRVKEYDGINIRIERDFRKRMSELFMEYGYDGPDDSNIEQMFYSYLQREHPDQYEKVTHPSETSLDGYDDWDYVIYNNYSLQKLYEIAQEIVEEENL